MSAPDISTKYYSVHGMETLLDFTKNFTPGLKQIFTTVASKYFKQMLSEMRAIVPVRTGYLRSTIGGNETTNSIQLYVDAHYAWFVDHGTRYMAGRPYFTGTVERTEPQFFQELYDKAGEFIVIRLGK